MPRDPAPQTGTSRQISLGAVMFAVLAPTLYVIIFFLVSIGYATAGRTLAPFAITATVAGAVCSAWAVFLPRSRVVGITTGLVILPCVALAAVAVISLAAG